jgi:hypothetical protein
MIKVDQIKVQKLAQQEAQRNRAAAYSAEADPLAFKLLRGEATEAEWEAKVEEIRARYPYPEAAES